MESNITFFPQVPFSFYQRSTKKYKEVNMEWALEMRPFIHVFQPSLASYATDECFKTWLEFLCHIHLFIRAESNPKYDQIVITIAQKHVIDMAWLHTAEDLFKKMRKDSSLQDEMTFLHQVIPIFKGLLKHATLIYDIRMNVQERFKIKIVQM